MINQRLNVAVIDNDQLFAETLTDLLSEEGYQVRTYQNTPTTTLEVRDHLPDLIILDLHYMLRSSSWKTLEHLRFDSHTSTIPIIVCSADVIAVREQADWLAELGVVVQEKPFIIEELLAKIERVLSV
jgi:DNA-binding response OmpR family regulator